MKIENENLIINADDEIKRMGEFVDKYTQEVDLTKKQMEEEYDKRVKEERQKSEELKIKMHKEQNEIE